MTYAARQDLEERFGVEEIEQLADKDGDGVEDPGIVQQALVDATATIDGYLATAYTLPLAAVPATVNTAACHLARAYLYTHTPPQHVRDRADGVMSWLRDIAAGRATLPPDATGESPGTQQGAPEAVPPVTRAENPHRTITYDSTDRYVERHPWQGEPRWRRV